MSFYDRIRYHWSECIFRWMKIHIGQDFAVILHYIDQGSKFCPKFLDFVYSAVASCVPVQKVSA